MKILLDASPDKIKRLSEEMDYSFLQLRTPLTQNKMFETGYALDNGCFSEFHEKCWRRLLVEARQGMCRADNPVKPLFVTLPDIVGDFMRTMELFEHFKRITEGLPRALVLQNGVEHVEIPWRDIDAVFVGGDDSFKIAPSTHRVLKCAKMMGKWVHVGRVNTILRAEAFEGMADSIDGSGMSRAIEPHRLEKLVEYIKGENPQWGLAV